MRNDKGGLVYSTKSGRLCPNCGKPIDQCVCKSRKKNSDSDTPVIKIRRETKGRAGKTVTAIFGIVPNQQKELAAELKQRCGTGGTAKDGMIIIQGDHRARIKSYLEQKGYVVKLAGG